MPGQSVVTTTLPPLASIELSSTDLENGNSGKGLSGKLSDGVGTWQLSVSTTGRVTVQSLMAAPWGKLPNLSTVADRSQTRSEEHHAGKDGGRHCRSGRATAQYK